MKPTRRLAHGASLLAFCSCFALGANASTFQASGIFAADDSSFDYSFSEASAVEFSAATTSFATGGFAPVLTLFNDTTGAEIDNDGSGPSAGFADASLSDVLGPGSYDLFLTEFPNVAVGSLTDGFLLAAYPDAATYTGDNCGATGSSFYNSITCTPTSGNYGLTVTTAPTPEPSTLLLVLPPAALIFASARRRFNR